MSRIDPLSVWLPRAKPAGCSIGSWGADHSTLDLRGATLDPAGATLTVRAIFGGFRLVVPPAWRVELHGRGIFGGFGDARKKDLVDPSGPVLTLDGFAIFGGVGILSEAPDLAPAAAEAPTPPLETAPLPALLRLRPGADAHRERHILCRSPS